MLPITQMLLINKAANPGKKLLKIKGVVMHWTANTRKGANALANRNFFNSFREGNNTSAHFIVDDMRIIQCVEDDEVAYHVGATKYTAIADRIREGKSPNYYLIGIEMCVNQDGNWNKTYQNSVDLAALLLKKHKLTVNDLYRHHDITGKDCPRMMVDKVAWEKFKSDVAAIVEPKTMKGIVIASSLNIRDKPSLDGVVVGKLAKNEFVNIYESSGDWYRVGKDQWVNKIYIKV